MPTVIEVEAARSYTNNNGKPTANREWLIVDASTEGEVYGLFGSSLPAPYSEYPGTSSLPYDMVLRDFSISQVQGRASTWRVVGIYGRTEQVAMNNPFTQDKEPGEVGYRTATASNRALLVDGFRIGVNAATYQSSGSAGVDIAGTAIDELGNPTSYLKSQIEIGITVVDRELPNANQITLTVGARNAIRFLDYPIGGVLFTGFDCTVQPETGNTQAVYKFLVDADYHLIQVAMRTSDGSVVIDTNSASAYFNKAKTVHLVQPFTTLRDFNLLTPYFQGL
jgi:hypothetical protein